MKPLLVLVSPVLLAAAAVAAALPDALPAAPQSEIKVDVLCSGGVPAHIVVTTTGPGVWSGVLLCPAPYAIEPPPAKPPRVRKTFPGPGA